MRGFFWCSWARATTEVMAWWSPGISRRREGTCRCVLTAPEDQLGELPPGQLDQLRGAFPHFEIAPWRDDFVFPGSDGVVIDALLGLQARGALRGVVAQVVAKLNAARAARFFHALSRSICPPACAAFEDDTALKEGCRRGELRRRDHRGWFRQGRAGPRSAFRVGRTPRSRGMERHSSAIGAARQSARRAGTGRPAPAPECAFPQERFWKARHCRGQPRFHRRGDALRAGRAGDGRGIALRDHAVRMQVRLSPREGTTA